MSVRRCQNGIATLALLVVSSCSPGPSRTAERWLVQLGVLDPPVSSAREYFVLADGSLYSTGTIPHVAETLRVVLADAVRRPGSSVVLWGLREDLAGTASLGTVSIREPKAHSPAGQERERVATLDESLQCLLAAASRYTQEPPARRSRIVEAIAKMRLEQPDKSHDTILFIVGDALESSTLAEFERGPLPCPKDFLTRLRREHLLEPSSLEHTSVHFAYATSNNPHATVTVARLQAIRKLWTDALRGAGATSVTFWPATPTIN